MRSMLREHDAHDKGKAIQPLSWASSPLSLSATAVASGASTRPPSPGFAKLAIYSLPTSARLSTLIPL